MRKIYVDIECLKVLFGVCLNLNGFIWWYCLRVDITFVGAKMNRDKSLGVFLT